jgi:beta-phosphoglucomutase-like phosphatase (HAD superfamily)
VTAFVFDLDGTLVDSVYHHVLAWQEALDEVGSSSRCGGSIGRSA